MKVALFVHSLVSCWNHGNAHFLRGLVRALRTTGHCVRVFEPADAWSVQNLLADAGPGAVDRYRVAYPELESRPYDALDPLRPELAEADVVLVHEWNDPALIAWLGDVRREAGFRLLFHDTHHRAVTAPDDMARFDLSNYDGVLAFGDILTRIYRERGWVKQAWTWHEAADVTHFRPQSGSLQGDLVWIGNWGDDERAEELEEFLIRPVERLGLRATVYGVRYPDHARARLEKAGIRYGGWLPNHEAPAVFAGYAMTVHVPRRPYARALPGIPTIRVFEALACGIPLISAPWEDAEGLFRPGDFLRVSDGQEMVGAMRTVLADPAVARSRAVQGMETVRSRHTCGHRAEEFLSIVAGLEEGR